MSNGQLSSLYFLEMQKQLKNKKPINEGVKIKPKTATTKPQPKKPGIKRKIKPINEGEEEYIYQNGWNEDAFNNIGLMQILDEVASMAYEIRNNRRGAGGNNFDSVMSIADLCIELGGQLADVGELLQEDVDDNSDLLS